MPRWRLEPGHTAAEFSVRHMMVCNVRGHFKNIRGTLQFDPSEPEKGSVRVELDAASLWTGEAARDEHLRSTDFLDAAAHSKIIFRSTRVEPTSRNDYKVMGDLTIRGVTRPVVLETRYLGQGRSPFDDTRAGFLARTVINRHDFGVSWNSSMKDSGVVVGSDVIITLDAEAIRED